MGNLSLTFACWDYDRVKPLVDGRVSPEGIDLKYVCLKPEETFPLQIRESKFDVSEFSLSYFVYLRSHSDWPYMAIPVFPSRMFRHSYIFINTQAGIRQPADLAGKTIGVEAFYMSCGVWVRGLLQHEYGLLPEQMRWVHSRADIFPWRPPANLSIQRVPEGKSLDNMLEAGEVDALHLTYKPACYLKGAPNVVRLFPNYRQVEQDYYQQTRLYPIMHTVIVRREILQEHPWVAQSLVDAFEKAKVLCYRDMRIVTAYKYTLPWLMQEVEETEQVMGRDFWPYGLEKNRHTLETFFRYSFEQGLASRQISVEELFAPVQSIPTPV
jgi:4,5-dihydroxyphthalate decarboxylase